METIFIPAPARYIPLQFYYKIDHLILNESDALCFTREEVTYRDYNAWIQPTINHFLERGVKRSVVVTMGVPGCHFKNSDYQECWIRPDVRAQDVVDTTGAGDTFVGAFTVACAEENVIGFV